MKKFLFTLTMLVCILLTISAAYAAERPDACPDCGNTNLGWFPLALDGNKDAHSLYCEPCYSLVGEFMELCEPTPGTATCVDAPICKVCKYSMSMGLSPDPDAHNWRAPQYQWNHLGGYDEDGLPVFACTATCDCKNGCGTTQQETVIATAEITTPSTCITQGEVTYTASFEASWAETQSNNRLAGAPFADHAIWRDTEYFFTLKSNDGDVPEYYGVAYRQCAKCYETEEEYVDASWAVTLEPTCTEPGEITYTAVFRSEWADSYSAVLASVPVLDHTKAVDEAVAATCTETGLTEGAHCSMCGEVLTAQEVVPAAGHKYSTKTIDPTCTEAGSEKRTCTVCGYSYIRKTSPATLHWFDLWTPNAEATHSAPCKRCDYIGTVECTALEVTAADGSAILTVCPVCGRFGEAVFEAIGGAEMTSATKAQLPTGEAIIRGMEAPFGDVLYAFVAAYEYSGESIPFGTTVSVSLPLSAEQYPSFELVRMDVTPATEQTERTEVRTAVDFTFENDFLAFEADAAALYLILAK